MVDNYRISVGGGPSGGTGDFDVPGFLMSLGGIPGYDVSNMMSGQMSMSFAAGDVAMQRLMTGMRAVGARAGMSGNAGIYKMAQTGSQLLSDQEIDQLELAETEIDSKCGAPSS